ncbi:protein of unknown function (plasmid) [Paraburkholderia dioscoreae]|uniref:Uncharacterized protein n=2 Tax=Paraburkholderia dioscoreae TaxID=2604047 RepID=A0A5Q4Z2T4_9BURK|nr:protein of unknown function [Paraburkholderia dioscoreae]
MTAFIAKDNGGEISKKDKYLPRSRGSPSLRDFCGVPNPADYRVSVILTTTATFASITTAAFTVKRTTRIVHEKWIYRTHEQL